jgi:hypothetical protein
MRRLASTVCTVLSLPNWNNRMSPGRAPVAALMAVRACSVMDFASGLWVHSPFSPTLARARPRAPIPLAISSSLSVSVREKLALAGNLRALTICPGVTVENDCHMGTPAPFDSATMAVRSTCCIPKRRSGLSFPYSRID